MNEMEKLLRKLDARDRARLLGAIDQLLLGEITRLDIKKLSGQKLFRVRVGRFRLLFSYDQGGAIVIHAIRLRNESTYL